MTELHLIARLREGDSPVLVCETCEGALVLNACEREDSIRCPVCDARPCADCVTRLREMRTS